MCINSYFEDLLNPADTLYVEEAEGGDTEVDLPITQTEVTVVDKKLFGARHQGCVEVWDNTSGLAGGPSLHSIPLY